MAQDSAPAFDIAFTVPLEYVTARAPGTWHEMYKQQMLWRQSVDG
jgi:hypothetical protein